MPRYTDGYREFDHYWCTSDSDEYELVEAESGGERVERKVVILQIAGKGSANVQTRA